MKLTAILADDEPLSLDMLRVLLCEMDPHFVSVDIVATCRSGREALDAIGRHAADLIFLDISMPDGDGVSVAQRLRDQSPERTSVIFTTAHSEFAAQAFDLEAEDYLLKPLTPERLAQALGRVRDRRRARSADQNDRRIAVPVLGGIEFIDPQSVEWVRASGDYITLHTSRRSLMMRKTLTSLAKEAAPILKQTHRSYLINPTRVTKIMPKPKGEAILQVRSGACIPVSRRHREVLAAIVDRGRPGLR